jgi:hypothetical protein
MAKETELLEAQDVTLLNFCVVGLDKERSLQKKGAYTRRNCSLAFWMLPTRMKKREDQRRRTTRDLRPRVANCTEVGGGICQHLL